jgi:hypothetical protein
VKLGTQYCPDCDVPIEPQSVEVIDSLEPFYTTELVRPG